MRGSNGKQSEIVTIRNLPAYQSISLVSMGVADN